MSKLSILYDKDIDYLEITNGQQSDLSISPPETHPLSDEMSILVKEQTGDILGFSLHGASVNLKHIFSETQTINEFLDDDSVWILQTFMKQKLFDSQKEVMRAALKALYQIQQEKEAKE